MTMYYFEVCHEGYCYASFTVSVENRLEVILKIKEFLELIGDYDFIKNMSNEDKWEMLEFFNTFIPSMEAWGQSTHWSKVVDFTLKRI